MTEPHSQGQTPNLTACFPLPSIREKQVVGMDFIQRAVEKGYRHVVLAAPTGTGKSPVGVAVSHWANAASGLQGADGAYYLVTQKLLQDQLDRDARAYTGRYRNLHSVKSGTEYVCPTFKNCGLGNRAPSRGRTRACPDQNEGTCPYKLAKAMFESAATAVTNYPYFFSEKIYVGQFPARKAIILDECHGLAGQAIRFVDARISQSLAAEYGVPARVPVLESLDHFVEYSAEYLAAAEEVLRLRLAGEANYDGAVAKATAELDRHICKIRRAVDDIERGRGGDWVFWKSPLQTGGDEFIVRPLDAAGFMDNLVFKAADLKLYMSAYPGEKLGFCRELGLAPEEVAWASLDSTFPVKNRPIVLAMIGSMGKKNVDETLPGFLRVMGKILRLHAGEKGLVHCNSYKLGEAIMDRFGSDPRLIFPRNAAERDAAFLRHATSPESTVLVSPSMTEGYDFSEDLARWQVIAKVPYPNLGDAWIAAKKERDEDWYAQQAVATIVQATGRIVRSDSDHGTTYLLDSDFDLLWNRHKAMFPAWWTRAVHWTR